jgi:tetratricopeptide (TPR) repeat protein
MRTSLLTLLLFASPFPAAAVDADVSARAEADKLYNDSLYQQAADAYEALLREQPGDPYLLYNAGNAQFRVKRPGRALLYYARAWRMLPRNSDMRYNLDFALKSTGQSLVPEGVPPFLHRLYYSASDRELAALASLAFWALCLLGTGAALKPSLKDRLLPAAGAAGGLLLFFCAWGAAVVVQHEATLRSGPNETFSAYAALPEGRVVKILDDSREDFWEAGVQKEGIKGWITRDELEKI